MCSSMSSRSEGPSLFKQSSEDEGMEKLEFDIREVSDQEGGASECFLYFFGIDKMEWERKKVNNK